MEPQVVWEDDTGRGGWVPVLAKHGALGCAPHGLDEKFHVLFATQNPGKMEVVPLPA